MCDTMVQVRHGRVLFAKNSDRDPNEAQLLEWHPARDHRTGASVRCTHLTVPQARRTHAVALSRPFWMWGAEMGANEHGVVIGNEAVFTDQPYADVGLTGMDLVRLALERAATAEAAVETITQLLERHGQGGGCGHERRGFTYHNSFLVADHRGALVLETAGRRWAVERVPEGARSISNGLTIPGFADEHADRVRSRVSACSARRSLTEAGAGVAVGPADLAQVLRDHGTGGPTPRYAVHNGAMAAPCMHAGGIVAASQTTGSWISELTPARDRHWATGTAAPCTSVFLPVSVDSPLDLGPAPTDRFDPSSWWWRHERLHRTAVREPHVAHGLIAPERDALDRASFAGRVDPHEAVTRTDDARQRWLSALTRAVRHDRRPGLVRRYWAVRDRRAGLLPAPVPFGRGACRPRD